MQLKEGRDHWYHELMQDASADVRARADGRRGHALHPLHVRHHRESRRASCTRPAATSPARYATTKWVFDLKDDDVYWCTADIGWVTGHSYVVYGPLANGATVRDVRRRAGLAAEGSLLGDHRALRRDDLLHRADGDPRVHAWGTEWPAKHDLSTLRLLGSVGEPINPEAWMWYHQHIGGERCPIVDTWWQTETGAIMITPLPGITRTKPGSATQPFPGHQGRDPATTTATPVDVGGGLLALTRPWPAMLRGIYGDPERYVKQYWSRWTPRRLLHRRRRQARRRRLSSGCSAAWTTC